MELDFWLVTDVVMRVGAVLLMIIAVGISFLAFGLIRSLRKVSSSIHEKSVIIDQFMSLPFVLLTKLIDSSGGKKDV